MSEGKILVVDDEPLVTTLINQILSTEGYTVLECNSAQEGLDVFKKEKPDLTLLDIGMPRMDGYEFCEKIKEFAPSETPAVVFLSGRSEQEDAGRSFDVGAFSYIRKPFSNASLKQFVDLAFSSLRSM
ncbi:MAG: response regulator [candidate division Zixibacteria bacterium]|nr:response regulator [candidate division Zixibacteria bacterium]